MKTKTLKVIIEEDEKGSYIPYCGFYRHPGIALRYWICEKRECNHYQRLYVSEKSCPELRIYKEKEKKEIC